MAKRQKCKKTKKTKKKVITKDKKTGGQRAPMPSAGAITREP